MSKAREILSMISTSEAGLDPGNIKKAQQYIKGIKNKDKKMYAEKYLAYLMGKAKEPDKGELGQMGAQAVRMNLAEWVGWAPTIK